MEKEVKFTIFALRIRYENIKNLGLCLIAFCLLPADGYAFEVEPKFCMEERKYFGKDGIEIVVSEDGRFFYKGKQQKVYLDRGGYLIFSICKNTVTHNFKTHRLVATCFVPNPENLPQVNHEDGNKQNNHYSNLKWSTCRDNLLHALQTGLRVYKRGAEYKFSTPILQLDMNGNLIREWDGLMDAVREFGYNSGSLSNNLNNKTKSAHGFIWRKK